MEDDIMNKKKVLIAAFVLALVLSIGGVLAYFSDSETKTNTFTV
jgi:predicted ribosomally synthesized peptide with SipW-like signal peptide